MKLIAKTKQKRKAQGAEQGSYLLQLCALDTASSRSSSFAVSKIVARILVPSTKLATLSINTTDQVQGIQTSVDWQGSASSINTALDHMNISGMELTVAEAGHRAVLFQPSHRADREVLHVVH